MSRVIMFSRFFPAYHPRKGEPTYFVEKILRSIYPNLLVYNRSDLSFREVDIMNKEIGNTNDLKHHTIRLGNRWKVGDKFSPRVWSDKPYRSKQIIIAPDIEVKKTWKFAMDLCGVYSINDKYVLAENGSDDAEVELSKNDGLSQDDLFSWFMPNYNKPKEFSGQIICWNEKINY